MIKPTGINVLIREVPRAEFSDGGIAYPANYDGYRRGKMDFLVVAAGPKCDPEIKPGCLAVLDQYRLTSRQEAGPGLWLVQDSAISIIIPPVTL